MNCIKILILCLFVSCSCNREEYAVVNEMKYIEEPGAEIYQDRVEGDTLVMAAVSSDSQRVLETKIDSVSTIDTNYRTEKPVKTARKPPVSKVYKKSIVKKDSCSGCMNFTGNPLTSDEAAMCAMYHWEDAKRLLSTGNLDSAHRHCLRGLSLYENGSLFCLKAKILNKRGNFAAALEAANISLDRNDHWRIRDQSTAQEEKCAALHALYNKYPSSIIHEKLQHSCAETENFSYTGGKR